MPTLKALHLIFMTTWFAALLYLPRLYVYHAEADDPIGIARFKLMEHRLFWRIMTPSALLTLTLGIALWHTTATTPLWLTIKLPLVAIVIAYHLWCWHALTQFAHDRNPHPSRHYRWLNEIPALLLIAIIFLAVLKPL